MISADNKKAAAKKAPAKPDKGAPPAAAEAAPSPTLLPPVWVAQVRAASEVRSAVSTAHRAILAERDASAELFLASCERSFEELREHFATLLQQEQSWSQRWTRQVLMLRGGQI